MKKIPVLFMVTTLCLTGLLTGCAKKDIAELGKRMGVLEREVLNTRTGAAATQEELRDLELRVDYLEREAVARGVKVPPRVVPVTSVPTSTATPAATPSVTGPDTSGQLSNLPPSPKPSVPSEGRVVSPKPSDKTASKPAQKTAAPAKKTKTEPAKTPATPTTEPAPASTPGTLPGTLPVVAGGLPSASDTPADVPAGTSPGTMPRVSESTPSPATPPSAPPSAPVQTEKNAYNAALHLYRTGRFPESEAAFQAFLEVYPNSSLVANALYWKGETYYSRGRFADAIFAFKDVQTRFPKHPKTPDSLLKTAMAYGKLGDKANESLHLTVLFEDWPQSEAAKRARSMGLKP